MYFKQFSLDGLACQSYLIGDQGVAAVVDPQRDVDIYLETAQAHGLKIAHVIETHLHADHVSGNTELAQRTSAKMYVHPAAEAAFPHEPLADGAELLIGGVKLRAIFTPGHTPDHICLTITDTTRSPDPWFILSGDTLFVGDVGRPDLLGEQATKQLAVQLYDSLHNKLLRLPDGLEVFPGHGAGSLCGRSMSSKLSTTIGFERRYNYALQIENKDEFVQTVTSDLPSQPPNVPFIKRLNREGPPVLGERVAQRLTATKVKQLLREGAVLVDTREPAAFGAGHVKGALNVVASSSQFATRLGFLVPPESPIIFVARHAEDCLQWMRAASRVGLDRVAGFITASDAKQLPQAKLPQWDVRRVREAQAQGKVLVLDVREKSEWDLGHAPDALHIPLGQLPARMAEVPVGLPLAVMCAGGVRSSSAASLLQREGIETVVNVPGGFERWVEAQLLVAR